MDRPVKPKAQDPDLKSIARTILSPSTPIEGRARDGQSALQALTLLDTLEKVARASLAQAPSPQAQLKTEEAPLDLKAKARAEARAALERALRRRMSSDRPKAPEAAPASGTPSSSPTPASQPRSNSAAFGSNRPHYQTALQDRRVIEALLDFQRKARETPTEQKPHSAFVLPEHPRVDAQPKPRGLSARRTPGVAYPVLRPPRNSS